MDKRGIPECASAMRHPGPANCKLSTDPHMVALGVERDWPALDGEANAAGKHNLVLGCVVRCVQACGVGLFVVFGLNICNNILIRTSLNVNVFFGCNLSDCKYKVNINTFF